jgi:hypothetical protein
MNSLKWLPELRSMIGALRGPILLSDLKLVSQCPRRALRCLKRFSKKTESRKIEKKDRRGSEARTETHPNRSRELISEIVGIQFRIQLLTCKQISSVPQERVANLIPLVKFDGTLWKCPGQQPTSREMVPNSSTDLCRATKQVAKSELKWRSCNKSVFFFE